MTYVITEFPVNRNVFLGKSGLFLFPSMVVSRFFDGVIGGTGKFEMHLMRPC